MSAAQQTAGNTACLCATDECEHASDCAVHNEPAEPAGECDCRASMTPAQLRALPGAHYSDGRRYSRISKAWIFSEDWNDREEAAYQRERAEKSATQVAALQAENERLLKRESGLVAVLKISREWIENPAVRNRVDAALKASAEETVTEMIDRLDPIESWIPSNDVALTPRLDGEGRCSCGMGDASAGLHAAECDKAIKVSP